jgi:hypothetical protein
MIYLFADGKRLSKWQIFDGALNYEKIDNNNWVKRGNQEVADSPLPVLSINIIREKYSVYQTNQLSS